MKLNFIITEDGFLEARECGLVYCIFQNKNGECNSKVIQSNSTSDLGYGNLYDCITFCNNHYTNLIESESNAK